MPDVTLCKTADGGRQRSSNGAIPDSSSMSDPSASNPAPARTTLPTKQHIRCYECTYEFDLTGRMGTTHCPKCRASLDLAGYTIDAECHETLTGLHDHIDQRSANRRW